MKVSAYKKDDAQTYALGATVVMEFLINRPQVIKALILHPKFDSADTIEKIKRLAGENNISLSVEEKPFNIISKKENCFVAAVLSKWDCKIDKGNHVVLVNPSNSGNLGTIIRSCVGFGVRDIAIIPPAADHMDPKVIRASMGASSKVNIEVFGSFDGYKRRFPENNLYPFMLDGSVLLQNTKIKAPFSLIFGNEASGLPSDYSHIGQPVRIEHTDNIDSLNLPIAASIALYEAAKNFFA